MYRSIAIFASVLFTALNFGIKAEAQVVDRGDKLVLTGSILSFTKSPKGDGHFLKLRMSFRNDGDEPFIVYRVYDRNGLSSKRLVFSSRNPGTATGPLRMEEDLLVTENEKPYDAGTRFGKPDERKSIVQSFDTERPGSAFVILEPREYHEFEDEFFVEAHHNVETREGYFVVKYTLSIKRLHPNPEFLRLLKDRWRRHGLFPIDASGDFSVYSEEILHIGKTN